MEKYFAIDMPFWRFARNTLIVSCLGLFPLLLLFILRTPGFGAHLLNGGPAPYDMLSAALAACTTMTLRMYANHKNLELGRIRTRVRHSKVKSDGPSDLFERQIVVEGLDDESLQLKLLEIANKCPVHRTLEGVHWRESLFAAENFKGSLLQLKLQTTGIELAVMAAIQQFAGIFQQSLQVSAAFLTC